MGGRLSVPKGPDGTSEISRPIPPQRRLNINSRTVVAPLAAATMAVLLYVYSTTSIRAAKLNARRHREADGGQISWHNESLRRHGVLEKPEEESVWKQMVGKKEEDKGLVKDKVRAREAFTARAEVEEKLKAAMGKKRGDEG